MSRRGQMDFYRLRSEAVDTFGAVFQHYFEKFLPLLSRHFAQQEITSPMFLVDWNLTLFTKVITDVI
jgi:hypothetical protein